MTSSQMFIFPSHKFEHLSHWYYTQEEIKKYMFGLDSNGTNLILNFMKLCSAILESLYGRKNSLYDQ
jgi:hypothetical protein